MATITPQAPGFAVAFLDATARRFAPARPDNVFIVGLFDRLIGGPQGAGAGDIGSILGPVVSYSTAPQSLAAILAESAYASTWTAGRVVGPAAVKATATVSTLTVTAKSTGAAMNGATGGLSAQVTADGSERTVTVRENGSVVATSPSTTAIADLVAWTDDNDYVTVAGASLPTAGSATNLAGGTDDRASITPTQWQTAFDSLADERYGPGLLYVDSTDPDVQALAVAHGDAYNRVVWFPAESSVDLEDALTYASAIQADAPDYVRRGVAFASRVKVTPAGEQFTLPGAAVDLGAVSRSIRVNGVDKPPFGPENSPYLTVDSVVDEWTPAERHQLYAAGVNVVTDDGASISSYGHKTLDLDSVQSEVWHQIVRMGFKFDAQQILRAFIGRPILPGTIASMHARLVALGARYEQAGALTSYDGGPAFVIETESLNTQQTAQARQLHAAAQLRNTNSTDWADLAISVAAA